MPIANPIVGKTLIKMCRCDQDCGMMCIQSSLSGFIFLRQVLQLCGTAETKAGMSKSRAHTRRKAQPSGGRSGARQDARACAMLWVSPQCRGEHSIGLELVLQNQ